MFFEERHYKANNGHKQHVERQEYDRNIESGR